MVAIAKRPALLESGVKRKRGGSRRPKATQSVIVEDKLKPRKPPGGRTRSSGYHLNAAEKLERQRAIEKGLPPPPRRLSRRKGTTAEGNTAAPAVRGGVSGVAAAPELNDEAASGAKDQAMAVPRRRMNSKGRPSPEEGEAMTNKIPKSRSGSRKATPDKIPKSRSGARKARGSREGEAPSSRSGSRTRASGKKAPLKVNLVDSVSAEPDENPLAAPLVEPAEPWGAGLESRAVQPRVLRSRANPGLNLPSAQPVFLDLEAF
mmetsp:Transcript_43438/g.135877  ORF Transcript_43438/g.135877 Transcript_43438/m.135877 type:complete len:262 (-) Transcript_43438:12-797(-)